MKSLTPLTRFIVVALLLTFSLTACPREAGNRFTSLTETNDVSDLVSAPSTADPGWTVDLTKKFYANLTLPTASGPILLFRTSRPAGSGALNLFPLGDTRAEPTTLRADQWLAGTTHDSLLLAPNELTELRWDYLPMPCTVTRLSTTGETLGTVTGARVVHPGGWVERFKDPEAAATTLAQESSASGVATELVHVETGTIIDATGFRVSAETLPTGPGIRLYTNTTADEDRGDNVEGRTTYSWFPATPDSTAPRTDDMPWITDHVIADDKRILSREIIHMEKK